MPATKPAGARSPIKNALKNAEAALLPLPDAIDMLRRRHGLTLTYAQLYARAIRHEIPGVHRFHQRNFVEAGRLAEIAALFRGDAPPDLAA